MRKQQVLAPLLITLVSLNMLHFIAERNMNLNDTRTGKFHYAWIICAACSLMLFISMGLNSNAFSIYQPYIISINGFTNTEASLLVTVRSLVSIMGMLTANKACSRFALRWTIGLGMLFQVVSRLVFASSECFPAYCAASAIAGLAYSWAGTVPISLLIHRWFLTNQGTAFGIGTVGSGFATILTPPLITKMISQYGLGPTFLAESLLTALIAAVILFLIRDDPEKLKMEPYSKAETKDVLPVEDSKNEPSVMQQCAIFIAIILLAGPAGPGFGHLAVHYIREGYSTDVVAWMMTYLGIALIGGKVFCGWLIDRAGGWKSNLIIGSALIAALFLCCLASLKTLLFPVLSMTLYGVGLPMSSVSLTAWARDLWNHSKYDTAVKRCTTAYAIGSFLFGPLPGLLADYTGSYVSSYLLFVLFTVVCIAIIQMIYLKPGI